MAEKYFDKFKTITYANNVVVDITQRTVMLNGVMKNPYVFYPVDISEGMRPDQIAEKYYNDPYMSWLLYMSNEVIDPYYGWYMTQTQFNNFIADKYGSYEIAAEKIKHYRSNWYSDSRLLSTAAFEALAPVEIKYWQPVYTNVYRIAGYERKKDDLILNTNMILKLSITGNSAFTSDEQVSIKYNVNTSGSGQVVTSNSSTVTIQHIQDDAFPHDDVVITGSSYVYGVESGANCIITACSFLANNITVEENDYWSPVSALDFEAEKNEFNKTIRVLDAGYAPATALQMRMLLKE